MIKRLFLTIFFFTILFAKAQENIPLESWRLHISYHSLKHLAYGDDKIFAAANNGIFYFDKEDNSINTITKMDGLSDVGISAIAYSTKYSMLLIGYENGNIDVWKEGNITNINTILIADLAQTKKINHFNVENQYCYISSNFGVLILNLDNLIIEESIQNLDELGGELLIFESTVYNDSLFLATESGIIAATLSPNVNILDYNNWKRFDVESGAPTSKINAITTYKNSIYAAKTGGGIYKYNTNNWELQPFVQNEESLSLFSSEDNLIVITPLQVLKFNGNTVVEIEAKLNSRPYDALIDSSGKTWIATSSNGLVNNHSGGFESIMPEGPYSDKIAKLYYHNNKIFGLSGGIGASGLPLQNNEGFYVFENGFWTNFNSSTHPNVAKNLVDIAFNPIDSHYYFASYGSGLLKYDGATTFENIDNTNSPIEPWSLNNTQVIVPSVSTTSQGLWVGNYGTTNALHFLNSSNQWSSFSDSVIKTGAPIEIIIAENNDKWIRIDPTKNGKIVVFNGETGKSRILEKVLGNGGLPLNDVYDIKIDKEGLVWIGTGRGVAYFTSTYSVENQNAVDAITPIVEGFPLLRDERVTAIAIDGGNRKWFGSENGLWLFDASTQKQIYYFNKENSPLISNEIIDIAIHSKTGEVFIATDKGIISFRSPATEGITSHQSVKIFPNPVLANFEGMVGISGLAQNSTVKITDISGKLIRKMRANGGTTGWDVRDYNGRRAATGMYLVFSASDDGEETYIGKIAVVE